MKKQTEVARWRKNRSDNQIIVRLVTLDDFPIVELRTWTKSPKGELIRGEGFAAFVGHLPQLIRALRSALVKARELGLIDEGTQ
jgi:hypothetical protein